MVAIIIIVILYYVITGKLYFDIIEKSYSNKLTASEVKFYKFCHKIDKLYSPYYYFYNVVYKSKYKSNMKNAQLHMFENRERDWLAQQLYEENRTASMVDEMFDIRHNHASNCDAQNLRQEHLNNCDASGVDNPSNW